MEYTDEYILSLDSVTPTVAAKYLGQSLTFVYFGMQDGVLPIGTAVKQKSKWSYDIRPKLLYNYKHGIEQVPAGMLKEMAEIMRGVVSQAAEVCELLSAQQSAGVAL